MKIIEGDYSGKSAEIIKAVGSGTVLKISTGMMSSTKFKIPSQFKTIKLINKDEGRTAGQFFIILLVALTLVGIPIAVLMAIYWRRVDFSVGMQAESGEKFIASGDAKEWRALQQFIGIGSLDSF